jgi:hypothetical protein
MPYISIVPISNEPPLGLTCKKYNQDEKAFKLWCKHHLLTIIGYENRHTGGQLQRFAAVCSYLRSGGLDHPNMPEYFLTWIPSSTKPNDFRTALERINRKQLCF